jgi:hypothetical protein
MRRRSLPSVEETLAILARRRTRPPIRPPPSIGRSLAPTIKKFDERFGHGAGAIKTRWKEIVGDVLARRTEPMRIVKGRGGQDGALELRVDGPAAALVQHQAPIIMQRLDLILGKGVVTRLRIVQGPVKAASPMLPTRARRKGPLDAAAEKALADGLAAAEDGPLKAALTKLGREVMRRNPDEKSGD